jgi:hypothetical protein
MPDPYLTNGYATPPTLRNAEGDLRSVGVEIEFSGIGTEEAAEALRAELGGTLREEEALTFVLAGSGLGDLEVKLDTAYAGKSSGSSVSKKIGSRVGTFFASVAEPLIPREVVTSPVPITALSEVDQIVAVLRAAGAGGTTTEPMRPLALHLNPETPDFRPETIVAVLKAFALLDDWLRQEADTDRLRRLLRYFEPYPDDYVSRLADPGYAPDMAKLIEDYIDANPTRNRDLDALPLLLFVDEARVRRRLPDEKIGRRPTFHYRLPDSRVGDPDWSVAEAWNHWVGLERVAADPARLTELGRAWLDCPERGYWAERSAGITFG